MRAKSPEFRMTNSSFAVRTQFVKSPKESPNHSPDEMRNMVRWYSDFQLGMSRRNNKVQTEDCSDAGGSSKQLITSPMGTTRTQFKLRQSSIPVL